MSQEQNPARKAYEGETPSLRAVKMPATLASPRAGGTPASLTTTLPAAPRASLLRVLGLLVLPVAAIAGAAAVAMAGGLDLAAWGQGGKWLPPALSSPLSVACLVILLVCGAILFGLVAAMWRIGNRPGRRQSPQGGTIMIEFALILPFAMFMVLLMVQTSLLMAGNLCVHYAAFCAARSAVTTIPLELEDMRNEFTEDGAKHQRLKMAAWYAVMPVSSASEHLAQAQTELPTGLDEFFARNGASSPGWVQAHLARKWNYAEQNTTVRLDGPLNGIRYVRNEDLVVNVEHKFYLSVPYVRRLFAYGNDGVSLNFGSGEYATRIRSTCTLTNEGQQDYIDVESFPRRVNFDESPDPPDPDSEMPIDTGGQ